MPACRVRRGSSGDGADAGFHLDMLRLSQRSKRCGYNDANLMKSPIAFFLSILVLADMFVGMTSTACPAQTTAAPTSAAPQSNGSAPPAPAPAPHLRAELRRRRLRQRPGKGLRRTIRTIPKMSRSPRSRKRSTKCGWCLRSPTSMAATSRTCRKERLQGSRRQEASRIAQLP